MRRWTSGGFCGGGRTKAIGLLVSDGVVDPDKVWIAYKAVPRDLARAVSQIENDKRKNMHPADQIRGFRALSEEGKNPAQIGALLGYGAKHVQRMLKLAGLAPELLALLAEDKIDVGQCQALSLESDPARQVQVYESVKSSYAQAPAHLLKRAITDSEISLSDNRFAFIGREMYEAAGGIVREDLFSAQDGDGTADGVLVDRLVQEKLEAVALTVQMEEGWEWTMVREVGVRNYGHDREMYLVLPEPEAEYTPDEQKRLDELYATQDATETYDDEAAIQVLIDEIEAAAAKRAWKQEQKAVCGAVIYLEDGELYVQRGIQKKAQDPSAADDAQEKNGGTLHVVTDTKPDAAEGISLPLLKKMSSERTLAVQAALMQQPQKAVALMVWRLCSCVFDYCNTATHPFVMRVDVHHGGLTSDAPTGKEGAAWQCLMQEKSRLEALLPEGWKRDFTSFFALEGATLMAFCTACSVDGVQDRVYGRTSQSPLDRLEIAIGFHMRDWWQPTLDNYHGMLSKNQIVAALKDAGQVEAAAETEKMKKVDAASHAERCLSDTRWVPGWMQSADAAQQPTQTSTPETDAPTTGSDVNPDTHTAEAA